VDAPKALALLTKAAEKHYPAAEFDLAEMYKSGEGGSPDPVQAYVWFSQAAVHPSRENPDLAAQANAELEALTATMTSGQIDQAKALVAIWTGH
jgi:TPR repeat protein